MWTRQKYYSTGDTDYCPHSYSNTDAWRDANVGTNTHISPTAPAPTLGIEGDSHTSYPGIPRVRFGYPTCGNGNLRGDLLKSTILHFHEQGVRVLLTTCQQSTGPSLFDPAPLNDAAQGGADAVQCGNEEMKYDPPFTRYIPPADFARYFDLCERAMHAVRPGIPVLLGSLDPQTTSPWKAR